MTNRGHHAKKGVKTKVIQALAQELRLEREKILALKKSIAELEDTLRHWDKKFDPDEDGQDETAPQPEDDQIWKTRFETQADVNTNFEAQIKQLRSKISEKKETLQELSSGGGIQKLKQSDLKKKIIQLQRQKNNLESQLKDYEWRIDKEAELFHKADEKMKAMSHDIKRNLKADSSKPHPPPKPLPEIKRGSLARGSYVRKLHQRRASRPHGDHVVTGAPSSVGNTHQGIGAPLRSGIRRGTLEK